MQAYILLRGAEQRGHLSLAKPHRIPVEANLQGNVFVFRLKYHNRASHNSSPPSILKMPGYSFREAARKPQIPFFKALYYRTHVLVKRYSLLSPASVEACRPHEPSLTDTHGGSISVVALPTRLISENANLTQVNLL
ncbi:hypothetical protein [Senegalimassilia sp.]